MNNDNTTLTPVREFSKLTEIGLNTCYSIVNDASCLKIRVGNKILIIKDKVAPWIDNNVGKAFQYIKVTQ